MTATSKPPAVGEFRGNPLQRLTRRLYVRIWLAVLLAMALLTLGVAWAWRMAAEPPLHEAVVRDASGHIVGNGALRIHPPAADSGPDAEAEALPPPPGEPGKPPGAPGQPPGAEGMPPHAELAPHHQPLRSGPEFVVRMHDGEVLHVHLPRQPRSFWSRPPFGFFWTLGLAAVAVALATYPIIRKLTRRLEELQRGVERWGDGDLAVRVPVQGHDEVAYLAGRFNHAAERIQHVGGAQAAR